MGGNEQFVNMLDSVFSMTPIFDDSYYGGVIHEIREMQIMNMGQYAHGNQPIQHMIYLYDYAGQPWKAQYWIRRVMNQLYRATPDGYCGDEDNGQTSAWYVFSALGFYPVCPGTDQYVIGTPYFKKVVLTFENGKQLVINAPNNSAENMYVQSLQMNGKPYDKNWLGHLDLRKGAVLNFVMGKTPNKNRGTSSSAFPYSFSTENPSVTPAVPVAPASYQEAKNTGDHSTSWAETKDSIKRGDYTLIFINKDPLMDMKVKQQMIDAFFTVYPAEAKRFNTQTLKKVVFVMDPAYKGVAATGDGRSVYNPQWLHDHPADIDVVTHEVMHIVQAYPEDAGPGWITEGIADYVRYKYGVNNTASKWALPDYKASHSYNNSYRITARFFVWLEKNINPDLVNKLDMAMRTKTYRPEIWQELTGKSVDDLWKAYAEHPEL